MESSRSDLRVLCDAGFTPSQAQAVIDAGQLVSQGECSTEVVAMLEVFGFSSDQAEIITAKAISAHVRRNRTHPPAERQKAHASRTSATTKHTVPRPEHHGRFADYPLWFRLFFATVSCVAFTTVTLLIVSVFSSLSSIPEKTSSVPTPQPETAETEFPPEVTPSDSPRENSYPPLNFAAGPSRYLPEKVEVPAISKTPEIKPVKAIVAPRAPDPTKVEEWKRAAAIRYPALVKRWSPMNDRFLTEYDELRKREPEYFNTDDWPLRLADRVDALLQPKPSSKERRTKPVQSASYQPESSGFLIELSQRAPGKGVITVENGTAKNAICKLINIGTDQKVCSFLVLANDSFQVGSLRDGLYRVIFSFGDQVVVRSDRFAEPTEFFEFEKSFEFETTDTGFGIRYSTVALTLHTVVGGNTRPTGIPAGEFERY